MAAMSHVAELYASSNDSESQQHIEAADKLAKPHHQPDQSPSLDIRSSASDRIQVYNRRRTIVTAYNHIPVLPNDEDMGGFVAKARIRKFLHGGDVHSVCYSPDRESIATGSGDKFARIFDISSAKDARKTLKHGGGVVSVCFSHDGKSVATGSEDKFARIFDVASGKEILKTMQHGGDVFAVCFSPDGNCIATGSEDKFARIFHAASGKEIMKTMQHGSYVLSVCFSPDGKSFATGSDDRFARIFDVASGKKIMQTTKHGGGVYSVCFSPDGRSIATVSMDGFARIFDTDSGQEILQSEKHGGGVYSVCFSPDGKSIATGSEDKFARIIDAASGKEILKTMEHGGGVVSVCFSHDGKSVATGSEDKFARIFDVAIDEDILKTMQHGGIVDSICFSPDGKSVATGSRDKFARIFDVASGKEISKTMQHGSYVLSVCFSPDGKSVATGSDDRFARIFEVGSGKQILKTTEHGGVVRSVCFSPNGKSIATGSGDKFARIFDFADGPDTIKTINVFEHGGDVHSVCFSPDGKCIATGSGDKFARIFDISNAKDPLKIMPHGGGVVSVCFSHDGKSVATGSEDKFARIFDVASGKEILKTMQHGGGVFSVCFSSDGESIATGSGDDFARVFKLTDGCDRPCMILPGKRISLSQHNIVALSRGSELRVLSCPHNFATDAWLPVSPSILLEWVLLPAELQLQCFISDSQLALGEFCVPNGGCLVAAASKWLDSDIAPMILSNLERVFNGEQPVGNAGLILGKLLDSGGTNKLPHAATIGALLGNVGRHSSFAARDDVLTQQLALAAGVHSIQKIYNDFWLERIQLLPSKPVVYHNVEQVSFSQTTRMYVASSDFTAAPVFENYFKENPQAEGSPLDFEALLIPFANASDHRDGNDHDHSSNGHKSISLMQALVDTGNIDIFGTVAVRALVQHKWQTFGLRRWVREFCFFNAGLVLLVVLCYRFWQDMSSERDSRDDKSLPPDIGILCFLFVALCLRSSYQETRQFIYSISIDDVNDALQSADEHSKYDTALVLLNVFWCALCDHFEDPWNWLHLLHIVLGVFSGIFVFSQLSIALPVLAVTAFLRWWGTLFYLQAFDRSGPYVRMLVEIVKAIKWFMLMMLISILATWNAFVLLLKHRCTSDDADTICEKPRNLNTVFSTMYHMMNTLLFGYGDINLFELTDYYVLVSIIFVISMIALPIVLLNMLIAIMGDSYELIQDRALRESVMMKANILLEIELFMSESEKSNRTFFPKSVPSIASQTSPRFDGLSLAHAFSNRFLHVLVPEGESSHGPDEYHGLMNALKSKIDLSSQRTKDAIDKIHHDQSAHVASLEAELQSLKEQNRTHQQETQALKQETQAVNSKLAEVLQILQSQTQR